MTLGDSKKFVMPNAMYVTTEENGIGWEDEDEITSEIKNK